MTQIKKVKRYTVVGTTYLTVDACNKEEVKKLLSELDFSVCYNEKNIGVEAMNAWDIREDRMH